MGVGAVTNWAEGGRTTSRKCARALCGPHSATASLRLMCYARVLPDEKERYKSVHSCPSVGMAQSAELRFWVVRTRTTTRLDHLHRLRRADLKRTKGSGGARFHVSNAHAHTIDGCVSKSSGQRCGIVGRVSRRLSVHLSSCTHGFCVAPAPVQHSFASRALLGYCDHGVRAHLVGVSVANDGILTGHFGSRTDCLPDQHTSAPYSDMSRYTRECGQASFWYNRVGFLPPSNTRRTASLVGVSGPPVTSLIMKIGLVSGRTTRPMVRRKKMRVSSRLWL